jgi:cystathionine beta-synthase
MTKVFDDDWLAENGLLHAGPPPQTVGDLIRSRGPRTLTTVSTETKAAEAVELMQAAGISQLPVLSDGRSVGTIQEVTLARLLHDESDPQAVRVGAIMARPLHQVDVAVHLDEAYRLLMAGNSGVLAVSGEAILDIVTRIDLIHYWNRKKGG